MSEFNDRNAGRAVLIAALVGLALMAAGVVILMSALSPSATPSASAPAVTEQKAAEPSVTPSVPQSAPATQPALIATPAAPPPKAFSAKSAFDYVVALESFGPRKGGGAAERRAVDYASREFEAMGYQPVVQKFKLPNGKTSHNVVARLEGSSRQTLILGAHIDSKLPAPGANDNLSGCGTVLELARVLRSSPLTPTVVFVMFGTEEMVDANPDHHHYGSRAFVKQMTRDEKRDAAGMVSVDMVAVGDAFTVRTMNKGPQDLRKDLARAAEHAGLPTSFMRDTGRFGWSDHEPFELAGIPAAWVEWRDDPTYHTAKDVSAHLSKKRLKQTGALLTDYVRSMSPEKLDRLHEASKAD
ncbi:MAG: M28 family peptidase [Coriobacteriia bacterium]|nr:M28 family peptidase [Coriobacteriia bacterium]